MYGLSKQFHITNATPTPRGANSMKHVQNARNMDRAVCRFVEALSNSRSFWHRGLSTASVSSTTSCQRPMAGSNNREKIRGSNRVRILENEIEESVSDEEWMKRGRWSGYSYRWLCKWGSILHWSCDRVRSIDHMKVKEEKKIVVNERVI